MPWIRRLSTRVAALSLGALTILATVYSAALWLIAVAATVWDAS